MKSKDFIKKYIAIVEGNIESSHGTINAKIARKENSIIERCINDNGDTAITHYTVINSKQISDTNYTIVECVLETGRTHQIRIHFAHINHPLLGDTLYGNSSPLINRQALHATKVEFIHPITKEKVNYIADVPEDIKKLL